jgi:dihydropteroate synthase
MKETRRPERESEGMGGALGALANRIAVVGIVNVTPDSFYDGGRHEASGPAVDHALRLVDEGADVLDVGGESTRPGAEPVSEPRERRRVLPVIEALAKRTEVPISIDTRRASVAAAALEGGASVVNAVAGLRDPELAPVCAERGALLILNHMRGEPRTMQAAPHYADVVAEVSRELRAQAAAAERAGVASERIWLDPGIGFGKHPTRHNLPLLARLGELVRLGYPVLVGPSRKSFIGRITGARPEERLPGTLAAVTACVLAGARAVRVHDVAAARQAVDVAAAIWAAGAGAPPP